MPITSDPGFAPSASAAVQERLWSTDPEGWALFSEPHNRNLFDAVLTAAHVGAGSRLLDIGCGSGLVLQLAAELGARVSGVDISTGLLGIADRRVPEADLRRADIQNLPFGDASFDAAIAINSFQFAEDPPSAIAEAARVLVPGGRLAIGMFAEPSRVESTAIQLAMATLTPPASRGDHAPYALSEPGNLERALAAAGFVIDGSGEVECVWGYDKAADAVRGLIGSAGGTSAVEHSSREQATAVIEAALVPFTKPDGTIAMHNTFRWLVAVTPEGASS